MAKLSKHAEWLSLVEVVGPFLALKVLDHVFPQGLDSLYPKSKQKIRSAYEEWCEAINSEDPELDSLHKEWIKLVFSEFLEYPKESMTSGSSFTITPEDGNGSFAPEFVLMSSNGDPLLFIKTFHPCTNLTASFQEDGWKATPLDKMTQLCRIHNVRLGLLTNGERWMLINTANGNTSGQASWYARLWFQEPKTLQAFSSLLGIRRFYGPEKETLPALLDESLECLEEITNTLGYQVRTAVEVLIQGLDKADEDRNRELLRDVSPTELYEAGLTVMMRLVFILCAEERGLLLLGNEVYDQYYAISTLRGQLAEEADKNGPEILERRHDAWSRLLSVFRAVYGGIEHEEMRLPALGGSLFHPDKFPFLEGRIKGTTWRKENPTPLPIDNRTVLLLLTSLQVLEQQGGATLLSYRALDVEQIGHVYEGLLEHTAIRSCGITLGLTGSVKAKNPNISLSELESLALDSEKTLFKHVQEVTGRSHKAIANAYNKDIEQELIDKLSSVCGGDQDMIDRIKPFANWLRMDAWEQPLVYHDKAFMVTMGQDRRETGAHYTPKILTEKIVKTTLEPIVYRGPSEGFPREKWQLKSPSEILNLKICDPAMGSGAFLVQTCRYLADRLCESWDILENEGTFINVEGLPGDSTKDEPLSNIIDERINTARRLIAEKCLYGVDINPLAVELAKLSIWLVTIAKGLPFGFLDHNLKSGDSLLGIKDINQLRELKLKPDGKDYSHLFGKDIIEFIDKVIELRREISQSPIRDITDVKRLVDINNQTQLYLQKVKLLADMFLGEIFSFKGKTDKLQKHLTTLQGPADIILSDDPSYALEIDKYRQNNQQLIDKDNPIGKPSRKPFHWALEFPEVFQNGGFDAICGNPPFSGGQHLTGSLGTAYRDYLVNHIANGTKGSADLVAYFYLQAFSLLKNEGVFGLIACNTIAEGVTRQVGLERLLKQNATIIAANPNMPWPGTAAVVISPVFIAKTDKWYGKRFLKNGEVNFISAFLSDQEEWSPKKLNTNANKTFQGSIVLGEGFTMSEAEAQAFIEKDAKNAEILFPYLNGKDLNSDPEQKPSRWVISFWDWPLDRDAEGSWKNVSEKQQRQYLSIGHVPNDYPGRVATDFPDLHEWCEKRVRPERQRLGQNGEYVLRYPLPHRWWQYGEKRPALYHAIGRGNSFANHPKGWESDIFIKYLYISTRHTRYLNILAIDNAFIFSEATCLFVFNSSENQYVLFSTIYQDWSWKMCSKFGATTLRFTPNDCFETFPFPSTYPDLLKSIGKGYESLRRQIMLQDKVGLTDLYNMFHNQDNNDDNIVHLRELQRQIDEAVRDSYGWNDIDLQHGFHAVSYLPNNDNIRYTMSEQARIEVLRRLSILNKQRWEEEQNEKHQ